MATVILSHGGATQKETAVSDLTSLPVAPEFVGILNDNAVTTALDLLRKMNAPEALVKLVGNIHELGYYLEACYRYPETLNRDRADRFDVETVVIETVNAIVECGGVFHDGQSFTMPRETIKVKVRK
jgi:hypothetical protein